LFDVPCPDCSSSKAYGSVLFAFQLNCQRVARLGF